MNKKLIILGSGGPFTLPRFFCECDTCETARREPALRRTRASAAILGDEVTLIDAGPDLEMQLERESIRRIDNILITHWHYDHVAGLGAINYPQVMREWKPIDVYVEKSLISHFAKELIYLEDRVTLHSISPGDTIALPDATIEVVKTAHTEDSVGYIFNSKSRIAYLVDTALPSDETARSISDADTLILDAMFDSADIEWRHFTVHGAIDFWKSSGPERCILTHLACHKWANWHWIAGFTCKERLQIERQNPGLQFAYDGLEISL
ncbi:MAG: MBL fold metallo-hydrolase [Candidatus Thorarchaeota archaeon]|nr:MBL fold metallo-hydrolase [Candidatus Thorarchaeota archaeon]